MAYPTVDNAHVAEAVALLTDHYRTKINVSGMVNAFAQSCQTLETVFWQIINSFLLVNNPVGDQLNKLGNIVGAIRQPGQSDADYLSAVKIQIRINRSQGLSEDVIQVATLILAGASIPHYVDVTHPLNEQFTFEQGAAYSIDCYNLTSPNVVALQLGECRSVGVYGELHYTTWAPGNDFRWGSVYGTTQVGQGGWGSVYTGSVGGLLAAGAVT